MVAACMTKNGIQTGWPDIFSEPLHRPAARRYRSAQQVTAFIARCNLWVVQADSYVFRSSGIHPGQRQFVYKPFHSKRYSASVR